ERDEVRGGEEAGAIAPRATDRIDHGANGAFAVCACDVDDSKYRGASLGERRAFAAANAATTVVEQTPDVFQAKFDPKALKAIKPGERLPIVHGVIEKYPSNRLISSRIFFRCTIMSIKPCSWRNSAVGNLSGKSWCVVSSITRGPAKPIMLLGSAVVTSPNEAKLAITPAVVGLVSTEI